MPTECSPKLFDFAPVEGRRVVAAFDGGAITSNAGALLLGATDRAIGLVRRFASCFRDARQPERVEHEVATMVGQRVFGIALGHEDVVDHDRLRHDPALAILAGKLEARRAGCAPLAGKSTLNRLEHAPIGEPGRYHRIGHDAAAIDGSQRALRVVGVDGPAALDAKVGLSHNQPRSRPMELKRIAMDTSKYVFTLHGVDAEDRVVLPGTQRARALLVWTAPRPWMPRLGCHTTNQGAVRWN